MRINIVDTPGHADFGGEVERILNMVDGAVLLVDAAEGPMPQTKFVLQKALKIGLRPIVCINKIDRPDERHNEVVNEVFDLFAALDASEEQLDFPIIYGSAKQGWMATTPTNAHDTMAPLFDLIVSHFNPPVIEEGPFRMLVTTIEANPFLGRVLTGRVRSGSEEISRDALRHILGRSSCKWLKQENPPPSARLCSMITVRKPMVARSRPQSRPEGPAPTTMTSLSMSWSNSL